MSTVPDPLATPQQVANYLGVPVGTLYKWRQRGTGPTAIRCGKHLRWRWDDVRAWTAAQAS